MKKKFSLSVVAGAFAATAIVAPIAASAEAPDEVKSGVYFTKTDGSKGAYYSFTEWEKLSAVEQANLILEYGSENVKIFNKVEDKIAKLSDVVDKNDFNAAAAPYADGDIAGTFVDAESGNDVVITDPTAANVASVNTLDDIALENGGELNLPKTVNATLDDADATEVTLDIDWAENADFDNNVAGEYTFTGTVKKADGETAKFEIPADKAEVTVKVVVAAGELKVESVSAINANQVLVTYNQELDKTTAQNLANYKLEGKVGTTTAGGTTVANVALNTTATFGQTPKATLQADGKSVLVTLSTTNTPQVFEGQVTQKLTVENVKAKDGKVVTKTTKDFSYTDVTAPTVASVTTEGNRVIVVKFSEYVTPTTATTASNYQLDGVSLTAYGAGTGQYDAEKNEVRFSLSSALPDKTYKLKVSVDNVIVDAAGFKVVQVEKDLVVTTNTTAAKLTSVEVAADKASILVKFDKPLAAVGNYVTGQPLFIDGTDIFATAGITKTIENGSLKLTGAIASFVSNGLHAVNLSNTSTAYLQDAYGVKVEAGTTSYTIAADTVKPAVTSTTVNSGATQIEVKFSEAVTSATAENRLNYTLKKADGTTVAINTAAFKSGTNDIAVLGVTALAAGTYTLEVKNVQDTATPANTVDAYTTTLTVADTVKPTVSKVEYSGKTVYVTFSENVNTTTATTAANYLYKGIALPANTKLTAVSGTMVKIELPSDAANVVTGEAFGVSTSVTDVAGNPLAGFGYSGTIGAAFVTASLDADSAAKIVATAKDTVQITFNKALETLNAGDFSFSTNNGSSWTAFTQQNVSFVNTDGKGVATFKLPTGTTLPTDLANVQVKVSTTGTTKGSDASTLSGTILTTGGVAVADKIAPEVAVTSGVGVTPVTYNVVAKDSDDNGKVDVLEITFSENLTTGSVSKDDFAVTGLTVKNVTVGAGALATDKVTLTLNEGTVSDVSDVFAVTLVGDIEDSANNVLKANASKSYAITTTVAATALATINGGGAILGDYTKAGITGVTAGNLTLVNATVAAAKAALVAPATALTKAQIQTAVDDTLAVATAKTNLAVPTLTDADKAITTAELVATQDGATVTWAVTTGTGTITAGVYSTPARGVASATEVLTATIKKGEAVETKVFNVTVQTNVDTDSDGTFDNPTTIIVAP